MPYIDASISKKLDSNQTELLKKEFGKAITSIPGKSEAHLMIKISDGQTMCFAGSDDDCAIIRVELFGSCSKDACQSFTGIICSLVNDITGIPLSRIYVNFRFVDIWGMSGFLF